MQNDAKRVTQDTRLGVEFPPVVAESSTETTQKVDSKEPAAIVPRFAFVDGIRGFLALWITVCHLVQAFIHSGRYEIAADTMRWVKLLFMGHDRTAVFFVVSGFCLMLPVIKDGDGTLRGGPRGFLVRRGVRLLPPYYLMMVLVVAVNALLQHAGGKLPLFELGSVGALRWDGVVSHLLLLHNLSEAWMYATYPPVWFVALEWEAYLIFALVMLPVWRIVLVNQGTIAALRTVLAVGGVLGYFWYLFPKPWNLEWTMPHYLFLFAVGMVGIAIAMAREPGLIRFRDSIPWTTIAVVSTVGIFALRWLHSVPLPMADLFLGVGALACLLQCSREYFVADSRPGVLRRFLEARSLTWVGTYSYSLFLVHYFVIAHATTVLEGLKLERGMFTIAYWIGNTVLIVLATALFYRFCEKPFEAWRERTRTPRAERTTVAQSGLSSTVG